MEKISFHSTIKGRSSIVSLATKLYHIVASRDQEVDMLESSA